jgi:hypothetical protein
MWEDPSLDSLYATAPAAARRQTVAGERYACAPRGRVGMVRHRGSAVTSSLIVTALLVVAASPSAAIDGPPSCDGHLATIVGSSGDDDLVGTPGDDVILALDGEDTVIAGAGDDIVCPGRADGDHADADRDVVRLGDGDDYSHASGGSDEIDAGDGDDYIVGGRGDDDVDGGPGARDYVEGGEGADEIVDTGRDGFLAGEDGDDVITANGAYFEGGGGDDRLTGGDEEEYLEGGDGDDVLHGGGGFDPKFHRTDYLDGGDGDDELIASTTADEYLEGGAGADRLESRGGDSDYLDGGPGPDELNGAGGEEYLDGGDGDDVLEGRGGDDYLDGDAGDDALAGNGGRDSYDAGDGADVLFGRDGQTDVTFDCGGGHDYVISDTPEDDDVPRVRCSAPGQPRDTDVDNPGVRLDADGDALLDRWELHGFDSDGDGQVDVDLPALGADPNRKDIFVAVAWLADEDVDLAPAPDAFDAVVEAFAAAPVSNVDGTTGISLHIRRLGAVPRTASNSRLDEFDSRCDRRWTGEFDDAKRQALGRRERGVYHFALIAEAATGCKDGKPADLIGGQSRNAATNEYGGDPRFSEGASDFFTSVGRNPSALVLRTTFMHELGHNLGLGHGGVVLAADGRNVGADHVTYEPNHLSVMNYTFSLYGLPTRAGGEFARFGIGKLDYSRFTSSDLPNLDETDLDETAGLRGSARTSGSLSRAYCPSDTDHAFPSTPFGTTDPVDWDCHIDANGRNIQADINADGAEHLLTTVDEWQHLVYDGGAIGAGNRVAELPEATPSSGPVAEPTFEQLEATSLSTVVDAEPVVRVSRPTPQLGATLRVEGSGVLVGRRLTFTTIRGTLLCNAETDATGRATCGTATTSAVDALLGGGYVVRYAGEPGLRRSEATGGLVGP